MIRFLRNLYDNATCVITFVCLGALCYGEYKNGYFKGLEKKINKIFK